MVSRNTIQTYAVALTFALMASMAQAKTITSDVFDTVIEGGRVMDPETNFDGIANIGIRRGKITHISTERLKANRIIDASGLVVSPGFIDIHSHTPTRLGEHLSVLDGITTQLDLEAGSYPPTDYGYQYKAGAQLHYGSSVGHFAIRGLVMDNSTQGYFFSEDGLLSLGGTM